MGLRHALAVSAVLVAIFLAMLAVIWPPGHAVGFDLDIATWMQAHRSTAGMAWFITCAALGSTPVIAAVAAATCLYAWKRGRGAVDVPWIVLSCVGATVIYRLINELVARPRPAHPMRVFDETTWSFPSGHSTQSMAYWLTAATIFSAGRTTATGRRMVYVVVAGFVAVIGSSRIYLCAHWTTDVIGGFALGAAWWCAVMAMRARRRA